METADEEQAEEDPWSELAKSVRDEVEKKRHEVRDATKTDEREIEGEENNEYRKVLR